MLSNFPSDDLSPPASEELVRSEFAAVRAALAGHDGRLTSLEERMDSLDAHMTSMAASMTSMDERMTSMAASMTSMDERMTSMAASMTSQDERMTSMAASMTSQDERMTSMDHGMIEGFAALRIEMHDGHRQLLMFLLTSFVAMMGVLVAAIAVFS
jgi:hypothetical protein